MSSKAPRPHNGKQSSLRKLPSFVGENNIIYERYKHFETRGYDIFLSFIQKEDFQKYREFRRNDFPVMFFSLFMMIISVIWGFGNSTTLDYFEEGNLVFGLGLTGCLITLFGNVCAGWALFIWHYCHKFNKQNVLYKYLTPHVSKLEDIFVVCAPLGPGFNLLATALNGDCSSFNTFFSISSRLCNPEASVKALPQYITLLVFNATEFTQCMVKCSTFKLVFLSWSLSLFFISMTMLVSKTYNSALFPLFSIFYCFVIYELERRDIDFFFKLKQLYLTQDQLREQEHESKKHEFQTQSLNRIISNVSHDLLSPVQALEMGFESVIRLLASGKKTSSQRSISSRGSDSDNTYAGPITLPGAYVDLGFDSCFEIIQSLRGTLVFMSTIIYRCLDSCNASGGNTLKPHVELIDVKESISRICFCLTDMQTRVPMIVSPWPENVGSKFRTDRRWFEGNLHCLLTNALKFSDDETLPVELKTTVVNVAPKFREGGVTKEMWMLTVQVTDSGKPLSDIDRDLFFKAPEQTGRHDRGGSGMGLFALAKRIEALGGAYGSRARDDGKSTGSVVWFSIPITVEYERKRLARATGKYTGFADKVPTGVQFHVSGKADANNRQPLQRDDSESSIEPSTIVTEKDFAEKAHAAILADLMSDNVLPYLSSKQLPRPPSQREFLDDVTPITSPEASPRDKIPNDSGNSDTAAMTTGDSSSTIDSTQANSMISHIGEGQHVSVSQVGNSVDVGHIPAKVSPIQIMHTPEKVSLTPILHSPGGNDSSASDGGNSGHRIRRARNLHVLVVDDAITIMRITKMCLEKEGHTVDQAHNGLIAVEKMKVEVYDAVLMDIQMPVMGGIEATRLTRTFERDTPSIKPQIIIGMSANGDSETREEAEASGMNAFIPKPFSLFRFIKILEDLWQQHDEKLARANGLGIIPPLPESAGYQASLPRPHTTATISSQDNKVDENSRISHSFAPNNGRRPQLHIATSEGVNDASINMLNQRDTPSPRSFTDALSKMSTGNFSSSTETPRQLIGKQSAPVAMQPPPTQPPVQHPPANLDPSISPVNKRLLRPPTPKSTTSSTTSTPVNTAERIAFFAEPVTVENGLPVTGTVGQPTILISPAVAEASRKSSFPDPNIQVRDEAAPIDPALRGLQSFAGAKTKDSDRKVSTSKTSSRSRTRKISRSPVSSEEPDFGVTIQDL